VRIVVTPAPFDPLAELRAFDDALGDRRRGIGAQAMFVGSMRDFNDGDTVEAMVLEHYPGMTEAHLERLAATATERWKLDDILIVHRVGEVRPGDAIVLVSTWSTHRAHAFESCRAVMEDLKSSAPFWKKERTVGGARWVAGNTPGHSADFDQA
jgi:molybdopterin synthase catalytic subunit